MKHPDLHEIRVAEMNEIWGKAVTSEILMGVLALGGAFFPLLSLGIILTFGFGYMSAKRAGDIKADIFDGSIRDDLRIASRN